MCQVNGRTHAEQEKSVKLQLTLTIPTPANRKALSAGGSCCRSTVSCEDDLLSLQSLDLSRVHIPTASPWAIVRNKTFAPAV